MELSNMFCPHTSSNGLTKLSEVSSLKFEVYLILFITVFP